MVYVYDHGALKELGTLKTGEDLAEVGAPHQVWTRGRSPSATTAVAVTRKPAPGRDPDCRRQTRFCGRQLPVLL